jgi:hypothetical protein
MKKFGLLLLAPALLSFIAVTNEPENNLKESGIKGDVKSITSVTYGTKLMFDDLVKGDRVDSQITTYNSNGMMTQWVQYGTSRYTPSYELRFQYGAGSKRTREILNYQGAYDYDREFIYDQAGNLIETNDYTDDGKLISKTKCKYNTKGQLFYSSDYYPNGDRKSRKYCYYDELGNLVVRATVNGKNVVQEYVVNVFDAHKRLERRLEFDGCMNLNRTVDYFYDGENTEFTSVVFHNDAFTSLPDDSLSIDENGIIHQPGRNFKTDVNGVITECTIVEDDETITRTFEKGVQRKTTVVKKSGYNYEFTFNSYGDPERVHMTNKVTKDDLSLVFSYNSRRLLTSLRNEMNGTLDEITYDRYDRIDFVKSYDENKNLIVRHSIHYDEQGNIAYSLNDYSDPAKTDGKETIEMKNGVFEVYDQPTWWTDGMMHTVLCYTDTYDAQNNLIESSHYVHGNIENSTFTYKHDATGNWIYRLETNKDTGKPTSTAERRIYYR